MGDMIYIPGSINLSLSVPFVYCISDNASEERTRKTKSDIQTSTPHCIMISISYSKKKIIISQVNKTYNSEHEL
jgi:hypothetical protein